MIQSRSSWRLTRVLTLLGCLCVAASVMGEGTLHENNASPASISLSDTWQCLGPFRIGTREAIWGADPLERFGGFSSLKKDVNATFPSALTANATVHWTTYKAKTEHNLTSAVAHFELGHPDVDWTSLQKIYGWSALQYQMWIRGEISNHAAHDQKVLVYSEGILELYVDEIHVFGGDFYSFNRAPFVTTIKPGRSVINLRLVRDVRSMGGDVPPLINVKLRVSFVEELIFVDLPHVIAPDFVNGRLPSRYMSIPVLNKHDEWLVIHGCTEYDMGSDVSFINDSPISIAPGQTRPVALQIGDHVVHANIDVQLRYSIEYLDHVPRDSPEAAIFKITIKLTERNLDESHKFTFLHPSKAVSYAVLKPPRTSSTKANLPLLLNLHGAGLEADSDFVRHMFDGMPRLEAFALFPTGMTPWSSDDWHVWGMADVLAAIDAVHDWIYQMQWNGVGVTTDRVLVSGHSNGGQGTWYFASHLPDRTVAAVPASGYTSIENYVPYNLWHEVDPLQDNILYASRREFKHELFIENFRHLPILQQHGSADDNVPPYHSRLMSSLRAEAGAESSYIELPGKGHWWEGAMTTTSLQEFYNQHLWEGHTRIYTPEHFSLVSSATNEMGYKFGIAVYQLESPDRLGRVDVQIIKENVITWHVSTFNVRALQFNFTSAPVERPDVLCLDGSRQVFDVSDLSELNLLVKGHGPAWNIENSHSWSQRTRVGASRGALDAIMRTTGPFQIISCLDDLRLALQISRNMLQYFGADSNILPCKMPAGSSLSSGNIIRLVFGSEIRTLNAFSELYPISFSDMGVLLRSNDAKSYVIPFKPGMGGVFLRPCPAERLELVVWGYDLEGLEQAARLVPTLSGGGQPDFVILARQAKWQGHGGALAMGFFDHSWNISKSSYLP